MPKFLPNVTFKDGICLHLIFYFRKRNVRISELIVYLGRSMYLVVILSNMGEKINDIIIWRKKKSRSSELPMPLLSSMGVWNLFNM